MIITYNNKKYVVTPRSYEPERMTREIAIMMITNPELQTNPKEAYRLWFKREMEDVKILYPEFRAKK
jgi:hypothetical protein